MLLPPGFCEIKAHIWQKDDGKIIFFFLEVMYELMFTQGDNEEHPFHGSNYKKFALENILSELLAKGFY